MHIPLMLRAAALSTSLLVVASCHDDGLLAPSDGPAYNHVHAWPGGVVVDVNRVRLELDADALRRGYGDDDVLALYHGGLAFGTGDTAIVWFDPRTGSSGLFAATDMRVMAGGPVVDHQTVSLLFPSNTTR